MSIPLYPWYTSNEHLIRKKILLCQGGTYLFNFYDSGVLGPPCLFCLCCQPMGCTHVKLSSYCIFSGQGIVHVFNRLNGSCPSGGQQLLMETPIPWHATISTFRDRILQFVPQLCHLKTKRVFFPMSALALLWNSLILFPLLVLSLIGRMQGF